MNDLDRLKDLLNISQVGNDWHRWYGITERRKDSLLKGFSHPGSFFNPNSESTLTLFMLGNLDGWSQPSLIDEPPRDERSEWRSSFFLELIEGCEHLKKQNTFWEDLVLSRKLGIKRSHLEINILLFEVELRSEAVHCGDEESRDNISFLDISDKNRWVQFDAVMILPRIKTFVFFESKFQSDVSRNSENYPRVDQIMKGLESAYLLTNHEKSPYSDWDFRYVLICPKVLNQYGLTAYQNILDNLGEDLVEYNDLLNKRFHSSLNEETYPEYFGQFLNQAPEKISKLHWKELGDVINKDDECFFSRYFQKLEEKGFSGRKVDNIRKKFKKAGIKI